MRRLRAEAAWLGGDRLATDVVIEIDAGRISAIVENEVDAAAEELDGVVFPGFVNSHSHAFHRALRGRTHQQGGDFWSWRDLMYRVAGGLTPDNYRRLAAGVFAEMLCAGITTVAEFHYLHHTAEGGRYPDPNAMSRALIQAATDAGIRLTLIDTCYLVADVAGGGLSPEQQRFSDGSVAAWAERVRALAAAVADEPMVELAVAAHSVRAVPAADLPKIREVADELGVHLHFHLSEQQAENDECLAEHGVTPTQLLADTGVLGPRATAVHATHLTAQDIELVARSGAGVCLCPTTERDLADGLGPAAELVEAGVELSVGSDSNAVTDMFEEARGIELHDRLRTGRRGIHDSATLLGAATDAGGRAVGWPDVGRLEVGAIADFVVINPRSYRTAGGGDASVSALLFAAAAGDVTDVFVGGRQVVSNGDHDGALDPATLAGALAGVLE